jgi:hypothetical protein
VNDVEPKEEAEYVMKDKPSEDEKMYEDERNSHSGLKN